MSGENSVKGRKLIVLGLPYSVDEEAVKEYFSTFGLVQECEVKRDAMTGASRGFGFVVFTTPEAAQAVLDQQSHTLGGRTIEPKLAVPKAEMRQNPGAVKSRKIFLGRLPPTVTEVDLKRCFEKFGKVVDVYIPLHHVTGVSRGFGFVTFETEEAAEAAAGESHEINGRIIAVDRAEPKSGGGGGGGYGGPGYGHHHHYYGGGGGGYDPAFPGHHGGPYMMSRGAAAATYRGAAIGPRGGNMAVGAGADMTGYGGMGGGYGAEGYYGGDRYGAGAYGAGSGTAYANPYTGYGYYNTAAAYDPAAPATGTNGAAGAQAAGAAGTTPTGTATGAPTAASGPVAGAGYGGGMNTIRMQRAERAYKPYAAPPRRYDAFH